MGYGSKHTPSIQKNKFRIKALYLTEEGYVWKDLLEKLEEDSQGFPRGAAMRSPKNSKKMTLFNPKKAVNCRKILQPVRSA